MKHRLSVGWYQSWLTAALVSLWTAGAGWAMGVAAAASAPPVAMWFLHDADGYRVARITVTQDPDNGGFVTNTARYLLDDLAIGGNAQRAAELQGSQIVRKGLWGGGPVAEWRKNSSVEDRSGSPGLSAYALTDAHGTCRAWGTEGSELNQWEVSNFDAFGLPLKAGSTREGWGYSGESWDADLEAYDLRSRAYLPGLGRFQSMDTFEADPSTPAAQHKYGYCDGDPVDATDPSGHYSVNEVQTAISSQVNLGLQHITSVYRAYQTVQRVTDTVQALESIAQIVSSGGLTRCVTSVADGFRAAGWKFGPAAVVQNLEQNAQRIVSAGLRPTHPLNWPLGIAARYAQQQKISAILLYMPSPTRSSGNALIRTGMRLGKWPVVLRFGGQKSGNSAGGTRVLGGGVAFGPNAEQQLFRMDAGILSPGHGNSGIRSTAPTVQSHEIEIWDDQPFHYHVLGIKP